MTDATDINSTLQGIARQLGEQAQSQQNAWPNPTAATSPLATPINSLSTTASVVIAASTTRHGLMFHNPGTASVYVYPTLTSTAPTTAAVGGSFLILPGGTLEFPPAVYPNVNCGWSAFSGTGSSQALTVVEFF